MTQRLTLPAPVAAIPPRDVALWAGLLSIVYVGFAWLSWDRTLLPDEVWALMYSERSWSEQIGSIRADLVHPPLFYALERLWFAALGVSNASAKTLPLIVNLVTIGAFTVLATRVTRHWRIASLLFLTLYLHVFGSPNLVRMYGLILLLTIVAILAWDTWRARPTLESLAIWTVAMCLAVLDHFFGTLLLACFVLLALFTPNRKALLAAAAVPAVVFGAWLLYVFPVYASRGLTANLKWVEPSLFEAVSIVPFHFLTMIPSGSNPVHTDWWAGLPGMKYLVLAAAIVNVALVGLAFLNRRSAAFDWRWLGPLTVFCVLPAIMLAFISALVGPAFSTRFLLGVVPAYWLWVVVLAEYGGRPGLLFLRFVLVPIVLLAVVLPLRQDLQESPVREAIAKIARERQPGDVLAVANQVDFQPYWEMRRIGLDIPFVVLPAPPVFVRYAAPVEDAKRVWVLCAGECNPAIEARLSNHAVVDREGRYLRLMQRKE